MDIAAVIGLGNPGDQYAATRHNVGFLVIDEIARRWRVTTWRRAFHSLAARRAGAHPTWLVKPQTFMNCSGEALAALTTKEDVLPEQCLVVVDDVELPLGQIRLRRRGGAGTHNGLRSIEDAVGDNYVRLRLGTRGAQPWLDLADYVLAPFEPDEEAPVREMVGRAADCVVAALRIGIERAANQFNRAPATPDADSAD
jgi:PTH1 family peptidyl-tRNA hydrolase